MRLTRRALHARTHDGLKLHVLAVHPQHLPDDAPSLLLLHGFAQNHHTFDAPGRSLTEHLARQGMAVYAGDLRGHGDSPAARRHHPHAFADYVNHDVPAMLHAIRTERPRGPMRMLGHSMGGLVAASLPHHAAQLLSAVCVVCPPMAFFQRLARMNGPIAWGLRRYAGLASAARVPLMTRSVGLMLHAMRGVLDHPRFPMLMPVWAPRSMEGKLLAWALRHTFSNEGNHVLADLFQLGATHGSRCGAVHVMERVEALRAPLLVVAADHDGLAPPRDVRPLHDRAGSTLKRFMVFGRREHRHRFGHLDVLIGRHAPDVVWPVLGRFLATGGAALEK
ncbi:MAG: alpha/beta fold hydrolase [Myxococcota bacterium]